MATTCANIIDRAKSFSTLNTPLTSDAVEMLSRIRADQQAIFTENAEETRDRFQMSATLSSSIAAAAREVNLTSLIVPLERLLKVSLADGTEVNQVDFLDVDAELAPRYFVRGQKLIEVGSDWGSSGAKTLTLIYVYGPTVIDIAGSLTQVVSIPDEWTDLLVLPLAMYLFQKDPGRDAAEFTRLDGLLDAREQAFADHLKHYGGVESRRFIQPTPKKSSKKN